MIWRVSENIQNQTSLVINIFNCFVTKNLIIIVGLNSFVECSFNVVSNHVLLVCQIKESKGPI